MACPCCVAGYVAHDAKQSGLLCCLASFVAFPCAGAVSRGKLRQRYSIQGSCLLDWCCHLCCPVASLVQEAAEVRQQRQHRAFFPEPDEPDMMERGGLLPPAAARGTLVEEFGRDLNDKELQKALKKKRKEQAKHYDWEVALPEHF